MLEERAKHAQAEAELAEGDRVMKLAEAYEAVERGLTGSPLQGHCQRSGVGVGGALEYYIWFGVLYTAYAYIDLDMGEDATL